MPPGAAATTAGGGAYGGAAAGGGAEPPVEATLLPGAASPSPVLAEVHCSTEQGQREEERRQAQAKVQSPPWRPYRCPEQPVLCRR